MTAEYQQVKLANPGDEITMFVEQVYFNPKTDKHKYPDFTFRGRAEHGLVQLYVPENACRRQFSRNGMEPEASKGMTVRFHRDPNKEDATKPYWGISVLSAHDSTTPKPTKRLTGPQEPTDVPGEAPPPPSAPRPTTGQPAARAVPSVAARYERHPASKEDVGAAYRWALAWAQDAQTEMDKDVQMDSVQAGAATILIALDKQGLIPGFAAQQFDGDVRQTFDLPDPSDDDAIDRSGGLPF